MTKQNYKKLAEELYSQLAEKIAPSWQDIDPYKLDENMRKPFMDEEVGSKRFKTGHATDPGFPFDRINKHIVKLKADTAKKQDHLRTYIFADDSREIQFGLDEFEKDLLGERCKYRRINKSKERADIFIRSLVKLSRECTFHFDTYPDEKDIIRKSRFFLIGEPGSGKTTFLNYLLSVYSDDVLIPNNSMIIRIDLNDAINKKPDFRDFILDKFHYVYREYFFKKGMYRINFKQLKKYIINKRDYKDSETELLSELDQLIAHFRAGYHKNTDTAFINDLMEFLTLDKRISYIFFIDGLDYVTLADIHHSQFEKWVNQLNEYIMSKHAFKGSYVISMRDISYHRALKYRFGSSNEVWPSSKKLEIVECNFQKMLTKKLQMAEEEINASINKMRTQNPQDYHYYAWLQPDIVKYIITEYKTFVALAFVKNADAIIDSINSYEVLEEAICEKGLTKIEKISAGNYRCIMRNLKLVLNYFASTYSRDTDSIERVFKQPLNYRLHILNRKSYRVLRSFIVGRRETLDYRTPYSYKFKSRTSNVIEFVKKGVRFVIPPITNFVSIYRRSQECDRQFRGLFKIRLLQYLQSVQKPKSISSLLDYFGYNFGYDKEYCEYDIEEMIYSQVLRVSNAVNFQYGEDSDVRISDLGLFILEELLFLYVYYQCTIDAIPVPGSVAKLITPLNINWEEVKDINRYIVEKAVGVTYYLSFLRYAEEKEIERFQSIQEKRANPKGKEVFEKHFSKVFENVLKKCNRQILATFIDRMSKDEQAFANYLLKAYDIRVVRP